MKLVLALVLTLVSNSFAFGNENIDFKNELSTIKSIDSSDINIIKRVKKSYKGINYNKLVCKDITIKKKDNKVIKRKVIKRVYNKNGKLKKKIRHVVFIDENGKKTFKAPFEISEIENSNHNLLTIELDSKNIKNEEKDKFTPKEVKFKVFTPEENFKDRKNKLIANLRTVDGKTRFDIDITDLALGDYDLFLRITSNKTIHLEKQKKKPKKFVHKASFRFTKTQALVTVIADLATVERDQLSSRIVFDMSGSSSSAGPIKSFKASLFENDELVKIDEYNVNDTTSFGYVFTSPDTTYQVELEVFDELGNSAKVLSEKITPLAVAPEISYSLTQNEEFKDLFTVDFDGSGLPPNASQFSYFGIRVIRDGVILEEKFSTASKFEFQIKTRGDFTLAMIVGANNGTFNIVVDPLSNLAPDLAESLHLNYSHHFFDEEDPRKLYVAFTNQVAREEFKQFNVTLTHLASGYTTSYVSEHYIFDQNILHALVGTTQTGEYRFDIELELQDGKKSAPFSIVESFNIDLGVALINLEVTPVENKPRTFKLDTSASTPGNYGNFSSLECLLSNSNLSEPMSVEVGVGVSEVELQGVGEWSIACRGVTSLGLIASKMTVVNVVNLDPEVKFDIHTVDTQTKNINITINYDDLDGYVVRGIVSMTTPSGEIHEFEAGDFINLSLWEVGVHWFSVTAYDNDGGTKSTNLIEYESLNSLPVSDFNLTSSSSPREYLFTPSFSDTDGYIVNHNINVVSPSGLLKSFSSSGPILLEFNEIGQWSIEYSVEDNNGGVSPITKRTTFVENILPLAFFDLKKLYSGKFHLTYKSSDLDGTIFDSEFKFISPSGDNNFIANHLEDFEVDLPNPGTWLIEHRVLDNDGAWSSTFSVEINVLIENIRPISNVSFTVSDDKMALVVDIDSHDADGKVVEHIVSMAHADGAVIRNSHYDSTFPLNFLSTGEWRIEIFSLDDKGGESNRTQIVHYAGERDEDYKFIGPSEIQLISGIPESFRFNLHLYKGTGQKLRLLTTDLTLKESSDYSVEVELDSSTAPSRLEFEVFNDTNIIEMISIPITNIVGVEVGRVKANTPTREIIINSLNSAYHGSKIILNKEFSSSSDIIVQEFEIAKDIFSLTLRNYNGGYRVEGIKEDYSFHLKSEGSLEFSNPTTGIGEGQSWFSFSPSSDFSPSPVSCSGRDVSQVAISKVKATTSSLKLTPVDFNSLNIKVFKDEAILDGVQTDIDLSKIMEQVLLVEDDLLESGVKVNIVLLKNDTIENIFNYKNVNGFVNSSILNTMFLSYDNLVRSFKGQVVGTLLHEAAHIKQHRKVFYDYDCTSLDDYLGSINSKMLFESHADFEVFKNSKMDLTLSDSTLNIKNLVALKRSHYLYSGLNYSKDYIRHFEEQGFTGKILDNNSFNVPGFSTGLSIWEYLFSPLIETMEQKFGGDVFEYFLRQSIEDSGSKDLTLVDMSGGYVGFNDLVKNTLFNMLYSNNEVLANVAQAYSEVYGFSEIKYSDTSRYLVGGVNSYEFNAPDTVRFLSFDTNYLTLRQGEYLDFRLNVVGGDGSDLRDFYIAILNSNGDVIKKIHNGVEGLFPKDIDPWLIDSEGKVSFSLDKDLLKFTQNESVGHIVLIRNKTFSSSVLPVGVEIEVKKPDCSDSWVSHSEVENLPFLPIAHLSKTFKGKLVNDRSAILERIEVGNMVDGQIQKIEELTSRIEYYNGVTITNKDTPVDITSGTAGEYYINLKGTKYSELIEDKDVSCIRFPQVNYYKPYGAPDNLIYSRNGEKRLILSFGKAGREPQEYLKSIEVISPDFNMKDGGLLEELKSTGGYVVDGVAPATFDLNYTLAHDVGIEVWKNNYDFLLDFNLLLEERKFTLLKDGGSYVQADFLKDNSYPQRYSMYLLKKDSLGNFINQGADFHGHRLNSGSKQEKCNYHPQLNGEYYAVYLTGNYFIPPNSPELKINIDCSEMNYLWGDGQVTVIDLP